MARQLLESDLLSLHRVENNVSPRWQPQEDFVVSDVFTPQTPEPEEVDEADLAQSWKTVVSEKPGATSSFRMVPGDVSPMRQNPNHGGVNPAKKKKPKKKKLPKSVNSTVPVVEAPQPGSETPPVYFKDGLPSISPRLRPVGGFKNTFESRPPSSNGISALSAQLDALNVGSSRPSGSDASKKGSETSSCGSVISESDQTEILTTYEVPLGDDFVGLDLNNEGPKPADEEKKTILNRKMTAADFDSLTCLGKGTFGTVLLVKQKVNGALYAQKQFRKASLTVHKRLVEQTKTERAILESVNRHPFVVKLFYAFQDHEKLYLILEYAQGGELFTHLAIERMFSEETASFYMAEMVLALEHLHCNVGVIYRDLKPENCLLDADGHLLLTDFGLSKVAVDDDERCDSSLGTIEYMAPEVILGKPYGKACDWWSLGALGFDLLTGSPPFKGNNHAKIMEKILKQKLALPYFLGPDAKDLLTRLLRKEPHKRLGYHTSKDMRTIKSHRFFRKIDWKALEKREVEPPIKPVVTDPALAENFSHDFTSLPLSPVVTTKPGPFANTGDDMDVDNEGIVESDMGDVHSPENPFGGFSFVAPSSLLESGLALGNMKW
ncbi:putative non-specific serine/threonine protein kinase [Microsporum ferrugineum]